ncbi:NifB/NifX family molybdenum-iron cluster-binding protein [Dethiothermospora halolimnae]|uniref:NifB/NifX family molybdenum-iron cluster-binding protein n=1 Tax=Dethiothermospora halolimnae TaxID=3114390 RepID=UPI003CCBE1E4
MKIALAKEGQLVSQHFGHCEGFEVINIEDNDIKGREFIPNPGHRPGFLPKFLSEKGIDTIISGGMGQMAQALFEENNIEVITGASGNIDDNINKFINNKLESTDEVCNKHEHHDECGEH